jgi:predicted transcriptional regulator
VPTVREADKVKKSRDRIRIVYDTLKLVEAGKRTKSGIYYAQSLSYKNLTPILETLLQCGLIERRGATEDELRRDRRSRWFIELTGEGGRFLRDFEALDKQYNGILLGE